MQEHFEDHFAYPNGIPTDTDMTRFARHIVLNGWSATHQRKLDSLRILVIGAGGLGCALCLTLVGCIGEGSVLTVVDDDKVELSNLHRQFAFSEENVGKYKTSCLVQVCQSRNSLVKLRGVVERLTAANADSLVWDHDVVFDCTDNVQSRLAISDSWISGGRRNTLISASCVGWCGQVMTLSPEALCCMRCVYGDITECELGQCATQGIMAPVVGVVANYQFLALIKEVQRSHTDSPLLLIDCLTNFTPAMLVGPSCYRCTQKYSDDGKLTNTVQEITSAELLDLLPFVTVIDVREEGPFRVSHLKGSVNIPSKRITEYEWTESATPVVLVCKRGVTSLAAGKLLLQKFNDRKVYSLKNGLAKIGLVV